jgi:type IV secretory pathway VirB2 component (pilin)
MLNWISLFLNSIALLICWIACIKLLKANISLAICIFFIGGINIPFIIKNIINIL